MTESLTALLSRLAVRARANEPMPDELCPRCQRRPSDALGHQCCACNDAGRVSMGLPRGDPGFGCSVPCPECRGGKTAAAGADSDDVFLRRSRIPAQYTAKRLTTYDPQVCRQVIAARSWLAQWPPAAPFLLFTGPTGTGKTHLAVGLLWDAHLRFAKTGACWNVTKLLRRYRDTFDADTATETEGEINRALYACPLLVLDDLGAHKSTEWSEEALYSLVDHRYAEGLATVITSNVDLGEMAPRVRSRLMATETSVTVRFAGPDHRLAGVGR
jgi:DNA replication protein DnaC